PGPVETFTPALLLLKVDPVMIAVMLVPLVSTCTPVPVIVAGGLAAFQSPVKVELVTLIPIVDVPVPRKLTRLPCGEMASPLIGRPLDEIVLPEIWKLVSVPVLLAIWISNSLLLVIDELKMPVSWAL